MSPRLRITLLAVIASLAAAAPATAAPRVSSLDAVAFESGGRTDYVVFNVRATGASKVRLSWGRRGQGQQRVRNGRVGIGFARRGAKSFRIHVRACGRKRCGRVRRFRGSFRIIKRDTDPPPNSQPTGGQTAGGDVIGAVPPLPILTPPITAPPSSPGPALPSP